MTKPNKTRRGGVCDNMAGGCLGFLHARAMKSPVPVLRLSARIYRTAERAVFYVNKVTFLEEFYYLNSSSIRKSITLMITSFSRSKFTLL